MRNGKDRDERRVRVRKRALVVDADVLSRIETRLLLEMHGFQVDEVNDGLEAVGLLDVDGPRLDLVVLDYEMPLLSGLETLFSLRALQPSLKALLCIPREQEIHPEGLPERTALLLKPCALHDLAQALDQVFGVSRRVLGHGRVTGSHRTKLAGPLPHFPPR